MYRGIFRIIALGLVLALGLPLAASPASAGPVELRELAWLLRPLFQDTYEGYALAERVLGRPLYTSEDVEEFASRLNDRRYRDPSVAPELEKRLGRIQEGLNSRGELPPARVLGELARQELTLAPLRASERIEFLAVDSAPPPNYTANREAFLEAAAAPESREVRIYETMGYSRFRPALLAKLQEAGLRLKPGFDDRSVLLGRASMRDLAKLSGLDGVDSLMAYAQPANARLGRPAYAPMYYKRGVKVFSY